MHLEVSNIAAHTYHLQWLVTVLSVDLYHWELHLNCKCKVKTKKTTVNELDPDKKKAINP